MSVDQQDFLREKVKDRNPKCGNCNSWGKGKGAIQPCKRPENRMFDGHDPFTTDLAVCSLWEPRS